MEWSDGDLWSADFDLPLQLGSELEYKYVVRSEDGSVYWKPGCNLCIRIPVNEAESWFPGSIAVRDAWDDSSRYIEQVGVREAGDEQELVSLSMERALRELDTVITQAFGMQESGSDPVAPELLAADRAVAAAARHAIALTKALKGTSAPLKTLKPLEDECTDQSDDTK
ncbi:g2847 [Coccomyxa elongata]